MSKKIILISLVLCISSLNCSVSKEAISKEARQIQFDLRGLSNLRNLKVYTMWSPSIEDQIESKKQSYADSSKSNKCKCCKACNDIDGSTLDACAAEKQMIFYETKNVNGRNFDLKCIKLTSEVEKKDQEQKLATIIEWVIFDCLLIDRSSFGYKYIIEEFNNEESIVKIVSLLQNYPDSISHRFAKLLDPDSFFEFEYNKVSPCINGQILDQYGSKHIIVKKLNI